MNQKDMKPNNNASITSNQITDYGAKPIIINIKDLSDLNETFRTALWTGNHFQLTLMSLNEGEDIGVEIHPNVDQFIFIVSGEGLVLMGNQKDNLYFQEKISEDMAFIIPAGTWHNLKNIGASDLKLFSIYAPIQHPYGTVHKTKADAEE